MLYKHFLTLFFGAFLVCSENSIFAETAQDKAEDTKRDNQRFEDAREDRTRVDNQLQEQRDQEDRLERQREDNARVQRRLDDQRWNSAHGR